MHSHIIDGGVDRCGAARGNDRNAGGAVVPNGRVGYVQFTTATAASLASPLVAFDGYSSFLDLNTADDTGVKPQAAFGGLNIPEYLQSPDPTGQLQIGWSAEGWYQALSLAHPATVFSCGESAASEALTKWTSTLRTGPAIRSIVVSVSANSSRKHTARAGDAYVLCAR